jgi:hypothetical protein
MGEAESPSRVLKQKVGFKGSDEVLWHWCRLFSGICAADTRRRYLKTANPPWRSPVATAAPLVACYSAAGSLAGIHFDRLGDRTGLVGELRKRQSQLIGTHLFRLLAEEPLAQDVQLMAQRRILALRACQLLAQRRNEGLRGGKVGDSVISSGSATRVSYATRVRRTSPTRPARTNGAGASARSRHASRIWL